MSARLYYRWENRRHFAIAGIRLTFVQARRLTKMLAVEYRFPLAKVSKLRTRRRVWAGVFKPHLSLIAYKRTGVSLLTVLHEVAHAIDWKLHRPRRYHTKQHAEIVDDLVRIAVARGWAREVPPPPRPKIVLPINMEVRHAA